MTFESEVQALIHADPFLPFWLVMASGDKYEITDPGFFVFGKDVVILVERTKGLSIFRRNQIVGVELRLPAA